MSHNHHPSLSSFDHETFTLTPGDSQFPEALAPLAHAPRQLHCLGNRLLLNRPALAIVGSRDACPNSLLFAQQLAQIATESQLIVVSGGARGIDEAAHLGALRSAAAATLCVLGTPFAAAFKSQRRALYETIVEQGGLLVTELAPGTPYFPKHFVERNRIISGLAGAVVVVRAHLRSGALSTAHAALKQKRPLWVVPGAPWEERAQGILQLMRQRQAQSIESLSHFQTLLEAHFQTPKSTLPKPPQAEPTSSSPLIIHLRSGAKSLTELTHLTGIQPEALLEQLLKATLSGALTMLPSGYYALNNEPSSKAASSAPIRKIT